MTPNETVTVTVTTGAAAAPQTADPQPAHASAMTTSGNAVLSGVGTVPDGTMTAVACNYSRKSAYHKQPVVLVAKDPAQAKDLAALLAEIEKDDQEKAGNPSTVNLFPDGSLTVVSMQDPTDWSSFNLLPVMQAISVNTPADRLSASLKEAMPQYASALPAGVAQAAAPDAVPASPAGTDGTPVTAAAVSENVQTMDAGAQGQAMDPATAPAGAKADATAVPQTADPAEPAKPKTTRTRKKASKNAQTTDSTPKTEAAVTSSTDPDKTPETGAQNATEASPAENAAAAEAETTQTAATETAATGQTAAEGTVGWSEPAPSSDPVKETAEPETQADAVQKTEPAGVTDADKEALIAWLMKDPAKCAHFLNFEEKNLPAQPGFLRTVLNAQILQTLPEVLTAWVEQMRAQP